MEIVVSRPEAARTPPALLISGLVVAILATLAIGGEYATGMLHVSLAAVPSRTRLLLAKAGVLTAVTLVAGALGVGVSVLCGQWLLPAHDVVRRVFRATQGVLPPALIERLRAELTSDTRTLWAPTLIVQT